MGTAFKNKGINGIPASAPRVWPVCKHCKMHESYGTMSYGLYGCLLANIAERRKLSSYFSESYSFKETFFLNNVALLVEYS